MGYVLPHLLARCKPRWKVTKNGCHIVFSGLGHFHSGPVKQESTSLKQKAQNEKVGANV